MAHGTTGNRAGSIVCIRGWCLRTRWSSRRRIWTAAVAGILERHHVKSATLERKQELAAVIHLCGAGAGDAYARRGLRLRMGERCGDHGARDYVARVQAMKRVFESLAAGDSR